MGGVGGAGAQVGWSREEAATHPSGSEAVTGQGWDHRTDERDSSMQKGGLPHRTQG